MKKFMQVALFMGTFLLGSQLFAQTPEKKGELPVCPAKTEKPGNASAKGSKGKYPPKPMKKQQHQAVPQPERKTK